ncbi:ketopantoate reductase family protein [Galbitalea soli]|uniref:2-dehydropantoate 2-reductase n=1 Tax=Galbitalea soli TaxID=1268042 RepID=A0A7C9PM00_9MICO|nr:2-dehydropantoate 2-reductase [Galbitalea soli]NEM90411.1 2-dehydropantoate 2-reductase [Galbitalea soli]NYJ31122.1 2-dehydropantoate 2-reductase [Galbitalea soli]
MRIGVIGAGAVGGALAALLDRAGHDVEVAARGDTLTAIRTRGLRLSGAWGDHVARLDSGGVLSRGAEFAIVATKAQDSADAIRANAALLRGIPVLVVQNGLTSLSESAPLLPRSDVVGGLALFAASLTAPGEVTITTGGSLYVGGGEHDTPARFVVGVLAPVIPTTLVADFEGAQWTKLVINQINALPAITGLSAQTVIATPALRRILVHSMREAVRTGRAAGARFAEVQGLTRRRLRAFTALPDWAAQFLPLAMARSMGVTPNPGSTLQSIRRGVATEIDHLNGAVVATAERLGRQAPVNRSLVELVHEVERSHRFLTPDEVVARIPLD